MYVEVLLPIKIGNGGGLTYGIPENLREEVKVGSAISVPIRNKVSTGIVRELHEREVTFKVKEVERTQLGAPVLWPWQMELAEWVSDYYYAPLYKVLTMLLPDKIWGGAATIPYEVAYERTDAPLPAKLGSRQTELIKFFDQKTRLTRTELKNFSLATLKNLEEKGLIREVKGEIKHVLTANAERATAKTLTPDQKNVFESILKSEKKRFLIHGITGSGKTEIYLRLAQEVIAEGKQVILMVPEIALTPQLIDYFSKSLGAPIAVLHSRLAAGEREREWWRIQTGAARVVIGSRSAVFAPAQSVGLIILDEEHEWSYKQDKTPYYHAREVAFKIGELTGAKVIMGSATPSVETRHAAGTGEIEYHRLSERVNQEAALPKVQMIDLRNELRAGNFGIFSETLQQELHAVLERKEQTILFLNRRGHATSVMCRECGYTCKCTQCDVSLTHHRFKTGYERLVCHHCGLTQSVPTVCPTCQGVAIKYIGIGTQRVEEELLKLFPTARVLRADKDTTTQKESFNKIYKALKDHEIDILIGTQMIGKGLDIANVTLVGVILADVGLHIPDFRAAERNFQLLMQVAGRAGRAEKPGRVIIQTYNPDHPGLKCLENHDYDRFFEGEIEMRRIQKFPPFGRIIKLIYKDIEQKKCTNEAGRVAGELKKIAEGPQTNQLKPQSTERDDHDRPTHTVTSAPPLIPRKHNKYFWHIYIQGPDPQAVLNAFLKKVGPLPSGWSIDVDPTGMG